MIELVKPSQNESLEDTIKSQLTVNAVSEEVTKDVPEDNLSSNADESIPKESTEISTGKGNGSDEKGNVDKIFVLCIEFNVRLVSCAIQVLSKPS